MQLMIDTDAAYLVAPGAKSRIGGYFYLSNGSMTNQTDTPTNAPIHVECSLLKNVVASAAEAETGGIFNNCQTGVHIKRLLEVLGHKQEQIPVKTDNTTACAFANDTFKQKKSKAWDMRYNWIRQHTKNGTFHVYWMKGLLNWADYFTKHHAPTHHRTMRTKYLQVLNNLSREISATNKPETLETTSNKFFNYVITLNATCKTN